MRRKSVIAFHLNLDIGQGLIKETRTHAQLLGEITSPSLVKITTTPSLVKPCAKVLSQLLRGCTVLVGSRTICKTLMWVLRGTSVVSSRNHEILLLAWSKILGMSWVAHTHDRLKLILHACRFSLVVICLGRSSCLFEFLFSPLDLLLFSSFHFLLWCELNLNATD